MGRPNYFLQVVERETGTVVETIDCRGKNPATVDKLESMMWLKKDMDKYQIRRRTHPEAK